MNTESTEPVPNLPLLRAVLAQIDAAPERWDQTVWASKTACGTAFCVAGWAVHLSHPTAPVAWGKGTCDCPSCVGSCPPNQGNFVVVDGKDIFISDEAGHLLGLTNSEADYLFDGGNGRKEVQQVAEQIAARAGESL